MHPYFTSQYLPRSTISAKDILELVHTRQEFSQLLLLCYVQIIELIAAKSFLCPVNNSAIASDAYNLDTISGNKLGQSAEKSTLVIMHIDSGQYFHTTCFLFISIFYHFYPNYFIVFLLTTVV